jgi:hypothetical protein
MTGMLSFAGDIASCFFKNSRTAVKLQLQLVLLDALDTQIIDQQQFYNFSVSIWDSYRPLIKLLQDAWQKWKIVDKSLLLKIS